MDNSRYFIRLSEILYKASKLLLASVNTASEMIEKGLLFGGERRKRSMAARMDFMDVFL